MHVERIVLSPRILSSKISSMFDSIQCRGGKTYRLLCICTKIDEQQSRSIERSLTTDVRAISTADLISLVDMLEGQNKDALCALFCSTRMVHQVVCFMSTSKIERLLT